MWWWPGSVVDCRHLRVQLPARSMPGPTDEAELIRVTTEMIEKLDDTESESATRLRALLSLELIEVLRSYKFLPARGLQATRWSTTRSSCSAPTWATRSR